MTEKVTVTVSAEGGAGGMDLGYDYNPATGSKTSFIKINNLDLVSNIKDIKKVAKKAFKGPEFDKIVAWDDAAVIMAEQLDACQPVTITNLRRIRPARPWRDQQGQVHRDGHELIVDTVIGMEEPQSTEMEAV